MHDGFSVALVEGERGRLVLSPPDPYAPPPLRLGAIRFLATTPVGIVEASGHVVRVDEDAVTVALDLATLGFEPRRTSVRHRIALEVHAVDGSWSTTTADVSHDAAALADDVPLTHGQRCRVALALGGAEVEFESGTLRRPGGGVVLLFDSIGPATRRAIGLALLRLQARPRSS